MDELRTDLIPRWAVLEDRLKDYATKTDKRLERIEQKVDALQSWADNLRGRFLMLAILLGFVSPLIVGLTVGLMLRAF